MRKVLIVEMDTRRQDTAEMVEEVQAILAISGSYGRPEVKMVYGGTFEQFTLDTAEGVAKKAE
jgi:hypothetical protein